MEKVLQTHKTNLKARQELFKMRKRSDAQATRHESPLFEPNHAQSPAPLEAQHNNGVEIRSEEHAPLEPPHASIPTEQGFANVSTEVTKKRKMEEFSDDEEDPGDDGNDVVEQHDPDSEPLPDLPMYHPSVKEVENLCNFLISEFEYVIESDNYKDDETKYLLNEAKGLEHPPHETHVLRIALIGDAGQGKSSLLNSVLGYENLAIHAADGNSCTYVVVEYAQAAATQKTLFEASVEFHSRQACRDIVKSQVKNYFEYLNVSDDVDDEEANDSRLAAGTCTDLLRSLFMGYPEFQDQEHAEEFLGRHASAEDPILVKKLTTWTENILDEFMPDGECNNVATLNAVTASEISESIQPFTMKVDYPTFEGTDILCCPWPLVKKVRVCLYSRILAQGTVIADLPGTTDKNRARVEAAKRYLQQCDMTIVVNKIDRAIDHATLHNAVNDSFRRRRSGNTIVVCTRSDDLNISTKQSFPSTTAEEKALTEISQMEVDINKQLKQIGVRLQAPAVRRDQTEKYKLMAKRERVEREKNDLVRKRLGVRISARNRHVKQGITDQYRQDTKDRTPLPIFCVSNPIYMQHLGGGFLKKSPPDLTLEQTEIPALRTHIFSKPSLGRFASLEHYCKSLLPAFLNTVEMSCSVTKIKRKEDLNRTFHKTRAALPDTVRKITDRFSEGEIEELHRIIANNEMIWINRARRKCNEWAQLKPAGYTAVLKHDVGNWSTKTVPPQDWNRALLVSVQEHLESQFEYIHSQVCDEMTTDISEAVCEAVQALDDTLKVDPAAALSGAIIAFRANLKERRAQMDRICDKFGGNVKKEIRKIQVRATTNDEDHYFTEAMKPVYAAAVAATKIRGKRVHDARSNVFIHGVTGQGGPFMAISEGMRSDWTKAFNETITFLIEHLDAVFGKIQHDVNQVCSTKEDDSPEAKKLRAELLAMLPEARERLTVDIFGKLAKCKKPRARGGGV